MAKSVGTARTKSHMEVMQQSTSIDTTISRMLVKPCKASNNANFGAQKIQPLEVIKKLKSAHKLPESNTIVTNKHVVSPPKINTSVGVTKSVGSLRTQNHTKVMQQASSIDPNKSRALFKPYEPSSKATFGEQKIQPKYSQLIDKLHVNIAEDYNMIKANNMYFSSQYNMNLENAKYQQQPHIKSHNKNVSSHQKSNLANYKNNQQPSVGTHNKDLTPQYSSTLKNCQNTLPSFKSHDKVLLTKIDSKEQVSLIKINDSLENSKNSVHNKKKEEQPLNLCISQVTLLIQQASSNPTIETEVLNKSVNVVTEQLTIESDTSRPPQAYWLQPYFFRVGYFLLLDFL